MCVGRYHTCLYHDRCCRYHDSCCRYHGSCCRYPNPPSTTPTQMQTSISRTYNLPYLVAFPSGCQSELAAAKALGYTQVSWDNESGNENQPSIDDKSWSEISAQEKALLTFFGYTEKTWDNESGEEERPASWEKPWSDLSVSGENLLITRLLVAPPALCETRP